MTGLWEYEGVKGTAYCKPSGSGTVRHLHTGHTEKVLTTEERRDLQAFSFASYLTTSLLAKC